MSALLYLFLTFFKIGLFAVGGGLATLPFLTDLSMQRPAWFAAPTLADIVAIAESTPGPIGINAATFVGFSAAGVPGALIATVALVLPSFLIVCIIARAFEKVRSNKLVDDAFVALRPAVAGLIGSVGYAMLRLALLRAGSGALLERLDLARVALFALLFTLTQLKWTRNVHMIVYVLIGGLFGILFC